MGRNNKKNKKELLILFSGGLDSYLLYKLWEKEYSKTHNLTCVFYDIGQPYAQKEMESIENLIDKNLIDTSKIKFRSIDWLSEKPHLNGKKGSLSGNIFIPGRNSVLATLAACQYLPDEIWMGALKGEDHEQSTDKNETFRTLWNSQMQYVLNKKIKLKFPFIERKWGKYELIRWALKNGESLDNLENTSSCLNGESGKCGKCIVCLRRWGIFMQLTGLSAKYNTHPMRYEKNLEVILEMIKGEKGELCHYDEYRRREIIPAAMQYFEAKSITNLEEIINSLI